jgi:uncharacterized protein YbjQ (UPF0145 family)
MWDIGIFLFLLALGFVAGSIAEKNHFDSLCRRENAMLSQPIVTMEEGLAFPPGARFRKTKMVCGSAVISTDYFKRLLAGFRFLVGGRVAAYESLMDRARREAVVRMKQQAGGAYVIMGMRLETANIGNETARKSGDVTCVEALAYGTAVWLDEVSPKEN